MRWIPVHVALNRAFRAERKRDMDDLWRYYPAQMAEHLLRRWG